MVVGFIDFYGVVWLLLMLGGWCNVVLLYDMCYYLFLIKKVVSGKGVDFVVVVDYYVC